MMTKKTESGEVTSRQVKALRGNTAKDLLRSLKTSIPVVKLASADPVLREYLLYTLLSIVNEMGESILTPQGLRTRELTAEEWHQQGIKSGKAAPAKFNLAPGIVSLLRAAQGGTSSTGGTAGGSTDWGTTLTNVPVGGLAIPVQPIDESMP